MYQQQGVAMLYLMKPTHATVQTCDAVIVTCLTTLMHIQHHKNYKSAHGFSIQQLNQEAVKQ
jgi:ABC-type protease/lipase transport system fused ATPase/permease subunit